MVILECSVIYRNFFRFIPALARLVQNVCRSHVIFVANRPDTYKLIKQEEVSKAYSFPKSYASCRNPLASGVKIPFDPNIIELSVHFW